jgi:hypothetical protein
MTEHTHTTPSTGRPQTAEEIERDIDTEHGHIRDAIGALEEKLSLGAMVDRFTDVVGGNGRATAESAGRALRENPAPLALIGVGAVWLAMASRRTEERDVGHAYGADDEDDHDDGDGDESLLSRARSSAARAGERGRVRAEVAARRARLRAESAVHGASDTARHAGDRARLAAQQAGRARRRAAAKAQGSFDENPLAVGALAFAAGVALGALTPNTRREEELLGPSADRSRARARALARDAADRGRRAAQAARHSAEEHVSKAAEDVAETAKTVQARAADVAAEGMEVAKKEANTPRNGASPA